MSDQFKQLTYSHQQIQELLDKVSKGYLLSPDEYKYLMNNIGLENISVFDGNYNSLTDKPDIKLMIDNLIALNNEKISKELKEEVAWILKLCRNELDVHIEKYEELKKQVDAGLATLDEDIENLIIDTIIESIEDLDNEIKDKVANIEIKVDTIENSKADDKHMHLSGEIVGLPGHINQTNADIRTLYKEAHTHINGSILNNITKEDIEIWNKKIGVEELNHSVDSAVANASIVLNLADKNYVDSQDNILQNYLEESIEQKYVQKIDYESYINQNKDHIHCIDDIYMSTVEIIDKYELCNEHDVGALKIIYNKENSILKIFYEDVIERTPKLKDELNENEEQYVRLNSLFQYELCTNDDNNDDNNKDFYMFKFKVVYDKNEIYLKIFYEDVISKTPELKDKLNENEEQYVKHKKEVIAISGSPYTIKQLLDNKVSKITREVDGIEVETHTLIEKDLLRRIKKQLFYSDNNEKERPLNPDMGEYFFDINIKKPIWWDGDNWIDCNGNKVDEGKEE